MIGGPHTSVGYRDIPGAISSILTQSFEDFEFIIVDDGSTDESLRIIESYRDPRIKIIRSETNVGLAGSLNRALEIARGQLIARMDADDISGQDRFQKQVEFLRKNPGYHLVGTWSKMIDAAGNETGEMKPRRRPLKRFSNCLKCCMNWGIGTQAEAG